MDLFVREFNWLVAYSAMAAFMIELVSLSVFVSPASLHMTGLS